MLDNLKLYIEFLILFRITIGSNRSLLKI